MVKIDSIPLWKKVYQTVTGYSKIVTDDIVSEILNLSKGHLIVIFLNFKPYTKESYLEWKDEAAVDANIKDFIHDISRALNLEAKLTYLIISNYLMFEYYGKIKEFWQITKSGPSARLVTSIMNFYTAERMFLLKTLRHIFEFADHEKYEFSKQYDDFVKTIKLDEFQTNLIDVYETLMGEVTPKNINKSENYNLANRLCRNYREQTEILMILTLTMKRSCLNLKQFERLVKLFLQSNFSTHPVFYHETQVANSKDFDDLFSTTIACYTVLLETYWDKCSDDFWKNQSIKDIEDCMLNLNVRSGHSIVILFWLFLKSTSLQIPDQKIEMIFDKKPFVFFHRALSNHIFKNCQIGDVFLKASHRIFDELCLMFSDRKILYEEDGLIPVITEFLAHKQLADICTQSRDSIDIIIEIAIETFPYDFFSFSRIITALLSIESQYKNMMHLLNNMPSFLSDLTWTVQKDDIYTLKKPQPAFPDSDLIIFPPNTTVRSYHIFNKNLIQYRANYNYFNYLEYIVNCMLDDGVRNNQFDEELVRKVIAGYELVIEAIKNCKDMDLNLIGLQRPINKINKMLGLLDGPLLDFQLVSLYFKVQVAMIQYRNVDFFQQCPAIVWKIYFPKLTWEYLDSDIEYLLYNQFIFDNTVLIRFFQQEEFKDDHDIVVTYIEIVYNIIKQKFHEQYFQISNIAYLLNYIFLQHQRWKYRNDNEKARITLGCLKIFHYILQKEPDDLNDEEKRIFYLCQKGFLDNIYIIDSLTRLFIKDKYHLIFVMEQESNWLTGPSLDKLECIRMQLAILLLLMKQKKSRDTKCVLDTKLPTIVKPIASFFTNSYNSVIADLSCRFLEKIAQDKHIPLLALLELDHYQVQALFLERLRDPLEQDNVKLAIIDLVNACITSQNGMTAAFFNLKCFLYWDGQDDDLLKGDTVTDFMVDYLQNIKKSHEYFRNPLQLGILRLLHNLWTNHRQHLITEIKSLNEFWPTMFDPFNYNFTQHTDVYASILKVVNLEMASTIDKCNEQLKKSINSFFSNDKQLDLWLDFLLKSCNTPTKEACNLLEVWMEFIVINKKSLVYQFDNKSKNKIILNCLNGILHPTMLSKNPKLTFLWCQLYMLLIQFWPVYEENTEIILTKLGNFFDALRGTYENFPIHMRQTLLSIANKTIIDLLKYFETHTSSLMMFLHPIGYLIDIENKNLTNIWNMETLDESERTDLLRPWLIIISICNTLMEFPDIEELRLWFNYRRLLENIMESVVQMTKQPSTLAFTKLAIHHLIIYGESKLVHDFLRVELSKFYSKITPPTLSISANEAISHGVPVNLKEWWLIFIMLIRLNRVLINRLNGAILNDCFEFMYLHDQPLKDIISLTKFTVDMFALILVGETLQFIHTLLSWDADWWASSPNSYNLMLDGVKTTINACILSMLGYKKINFYHINTEKTLEIITEVPTDLLGSVLNKLVEIIYWGASCLKKTKPPLTKLIDNFYNKQQIRLIIKNDFSVPRFESPITPELTYGKLLCLAHYLCRALNQLSPNTPVLTPRRRQVSMTDLDEEIKLKSLRNIFEHCTATYEECIGFMVYYQKTEDVPNEKLSSVLHYDTTDISGISGLSLLNYHMVQNALEVLMSFLAVEISFTLKLLDGEVFFAYKRELCSEIQFFYEFVRKRTSEFYNAMAPTSPRLKINQNSSDMIVHYMIMQKNNDRTFDVVDNNFLLVIAQWLIKFCDISN